ncbi:hypothetical protein H0H93_012347 [Arthromyces matolae]|nr:hypothetical protein H0H93_012347 [Arthromyces matolae]
MNDMPIAKRTTLERLVKKGIVLPIFAADNVVKIGPLSVSLPHPVPLKVIEHATKVEVPCWSRPPAQEVLFLPNPSPSSPPKGLAPISKVSERKRSPTQDFRPHVSSPLAHQTAQQPLIKGSTPISITTTSDTKKRRRDETSTATPAPIVKRTKTERPYISTKSAKGPRRAPVATTSRGSDPLPPGPYVAPRLPQTIHHMQHGLAQRTATTNGVFNCPPSGVGIAPPTPVMYQPSSSVASAYRSLQPPPNQSRLTYPYHHHSHPSLGSNYSGYPYATGL